MELVRYSCDCVALRLNEKENYIISTCNRDHSDYSINFWYSRRDFTGKNFTVLSNDEAMSWLDVLAKLVYDGNRFRTIQSLLKE